MCCTLHYAIPFTPKIYRFIVLYVTIVPISQARTSARTQSSWKKLHTWILIYKKANYVVCVSERWKPCANFGFTANFIHEVELSKFCRKAHAKLFTIRYKTTTLGLSWSSLVASWSSLVSCVSYDVFLQRGRRVSRVLLKTGCCDKCEFA